MRTGQMNGLCDEMELSGGRVVQLRSRQPHGMQDPLRPIRRPPNYFAPLDRTSDAFPPDERTYRAALGVTNHLEGARPDDLLLQWLSQVPLSDMRAFTKRGGRIVFASSFVAAATSDQASRRRGRPIHPVTRAAYEDFDRTDGFGAYDEELDWMIFPACAGSIDGERLVLHEFGHAMTVPLWSRRAHLRGDLLVGVPSQINDLLAHYRQGEDREAIRERVLEALAEAYAWMCLGRWAELPGRLRTTVWSVASGNAMSQAS